MKNDLATPRPWVSDGRMIFGTGFDSALCIAEFQTKEDSILCANSVNNFAALLEACKVFLSCAPSDDYALGYQEARQKLAKAIFTTERNKK